VLKKSPTTTWRPFSRNEVSHLLGRMNFHCAKRKENERKLPPEIPRRVFQHNRPKAVRPASVNGQ
jgi:hypothetical protein